MNKEEICFLSAYEMREKIHSQEITSSEITEKFIERIKKINPIINAYCTTTFDLALEQAKQADDLIRKGENLKLLTGLPISIKDLMQTKGIKTTYGFKLYEDFIPEENDVAYERLVNQGTVMLGKTNTPAFGHIALTKNKIFGETKTPWDTERNSGGSSGGAAASVAAGLGPLALGSDGGGSIRVPSSCCGVFGLKPTYGRIPSYPHIGIAFHSLGHYGPIVRYVIDAALMLNVLKGHHPADPDSFPDDGIDYVKTLEERPKKLKIGYSTSLGFGKLIEDEVKENIINNAKKFEQFNWDVEEAKMKIKNPDTSFKTLVCVGTAFDLQKQYSDSPDIFDPDLAAQIKLGLDNNSINIGKANALRKQLYDTMYRYFQNYDLLITPTLPCTAIKPVWSETGVIFPQIGKKAMNVTTWMTFTFPFNLTGLPAASIPSGWDSKGLPIGMQIVGRRFDEKTVLQVAKAFEDISPWQNKKPSFN